MLHATMLEVAKRRNEHENARAFDNTEKNE